MYPDEKMLQGKDERTRTKNGSFAFIKQGEQELLEQGGVLRMFSRMY